MEGPAEHSIQEPPVDPELIQVRDGIVRQSGIEARLVKGIQAGVWDSIVDTFSPPDPDAIPTILYPSDWPFVWLWMAQSNSGREGPAKLNTSVGIANAVKLYEALSVPDVLDRTLCPVWHPGYLGFLDGFMLHTQKAKTDQFLSSTISAFTRQAVDQHFGTEALGYLLLQRFLASDAKLQMLKSLERQEAAQKGSPAPPADSPGFYEDAGQPLLRHYMDRIKSTDLELEVTRAKELQHEKKILALDDLFMDWTFRALFFAESKDDDAGRQIMILTDQLEAELKKHFVGEAVIRTLAKPELAAIWALAYRQAKLGYGWRTLFRSAIEKAASIRGALLNQFLTPEKAPTKLTALRTAMNDLLVVSCICGAAPPAVAETKHRELADLPAHQPEPATPAGSDAKAPDCPFRAILHSAEGYWEVHWQGVYDWPHVQVSAQNKSLHVLFDALRTSEWDSNRKEGRILLRKLLMLHWKDDSEWYSEATQSKVEEYQDMHRDGKDPGKRRYFQAKAKGDLEAEVSVQIRERVRKNVERAKDALTQECTSAEARKKVARLVQLKDSQLWTSIESFDVHVEIL